MSDPLFHGLFKTLIDENTGAQQRYKIATKENIVLVRKGGKEALDPCCPPDQRDMEDVYGITCFSKLNQPAVTQDTVECSSAIRRGEYNGAIQRHQQRV